MVHASQRRHGPKFCTSLARPLGLHCMDSSVDTQACANSASVSSATLEYGNYLSSRRVVGGTLSASLTFPWTAIPSTRRLALARLRSKMITRGRSIALIWFATTCACASPRARRARRTYARRASTPVCATFRAATATAVEPSRKLTNYDAEDDRFRITCDRFHWPSRHSFVSDESGDCAGGDDQLGGYSYVHGAHDEFVCWSMWRYSAIWLRMQPDLQISGHVLR